MMLVAVALVFDFAPLERASLLAYDAAEPVFRPAGKGDRTVIVAVDEASVGALGRWPWDRSLHGELVRRLTAAEVAAIGFPVLFSEPAPGDAAFGAALAAAGRVVLAVAPGHLGTGPGVFEVLPTPELAVAAAALGHVDVELDADALVRRTYRKAGSGSAKWQALSLAVFELGRLHQGGAGLGREPQLAALPAAAMAWVRDGEMLLPAADNETRIPRYSYYDVLADPQLAASLRGKTVFVGTTAAGLAAGLAGPGSDHGAPLPAVELHARAHEALLKDQVYRTAGPTLTLALTLLFLAVLALLYPRLGMRAALAAGALVLVPPLASGIVLAVTRVWIPPGAAMLGFALGYLLWFAFALKQTRGFLRRAHRDADATLRSITDGVVTLDREGTIVFANPVAERLFGLGQAELRGKVLMEALRPCTAEAGQICSLQARCAASGETFALPEPIAWTAPSSGDLVLKLTAAPVGSRPDGVVLAFNDVTDTVAAASRLLFEATHDPLTGLPNRTLLRDRLRVSLTQAERRQRLVALLFVDLDRFKRINDSLGHQCGDDVLRVVAERLTAAVRADDTVSRWGGDEFIILMDNLADRSAVVTVARKVLELIDREVSTLEGSRVVLSCSIGISVGPDDSKDADTLLSMADQAMYRGKIEGGGGYVFFSNDMNTWSRERLNMESALRQALEKREFELFYQPQIDIHSGTLVGLEALLRWRKPGEGLIPPDLFIPAAEESGIIRSIGEWTLHEACGQVARWNAAGLKSVPVSVNVSARQCSGMGLAGTIRAALEATAIAPAQLKIEITETTAMRDVDNVATLLHAIAALGVAVSMDDFGTGYSSLSWLKRFPISELKIDKSFVDDLAAGHDDAAIVRGMIALANGLGMGVVAEGVESCSQFSFLAAHGCDVAQGFLFARALPADEIASWLVAPPAHVLESIESAGRDEAAGGGHRQAPGR